MEFIALLMANKAALGGLLAGLMLVATAITRMTKTPKDDKVVAKIRGVLSRFSLLEYGDKGTKMKLPVRQAGKPVKVAVRRDSSE